MRVPFHQQKNGLPALCYGFIYLRDRTLSPAAEALISEVQTVEAELAARQR